MYRSAHPACRFSCSTNQFRPFQCWIHPETGNGLPEWSFERHFAVHPQVREAPQNGGRSYSSVGIQAMKCDVTGFSSKLLGEFGGARY
jgi:hypothetical protein